MPPKVKGTLRSESRRIVGVQRINSGARRGQNVGGVAAPCQSLFDDSEIMDAVAVTHAVKK